MSACWSTPRQPDLIASLKGKKGAAHAGRPFLLLEHSTSHVPATERTEVD